MLLSTLPISLALPGCRAALVLYPLSFPFPCPIPRLAVHLRDATRPSVCELMVMPRAAHLGRRSWVGRHRQAERLGPLSCAAEYLLSQGLWVEDTRNKEHERMYSNCYTWFG